MNKPTVPERYLGYPLLQITHRTLVKTDYTWNQDIIGTRFPKDREITGENVVISVLDTGVNPNHQALANRVIGGYDFITDSEEIYDNSGHGTHVASIAIGSTIDLGVMGVASKSKILSMKVLNKDNIGEWENVIRGIYLSIELGADIINMSLGAISAPSSVEQAIIEALKQGIYIVASSGNHGSSSELYPAAYDGVISVGASDQQDEKWILSSGNEVDVYAPGVAVAGAFHQDNQSIAFYSGTSQAAPHVSGALALYKEVRSTFDTMISDRDFTRGGIHRLNCKNIRRTDEEVFLPISY